MAIRSALFVIASLLLTAFDAEPVGTEASPAVGLAAETDGLPPPTGELKRTRTVRNHFDVNRTGSLGEILENTSGHTAQFRIYNNDDKKITVSLSCSFTGQVSACSAASSKTIYPESSRTVDVTFSVGTGGTGSVTLTATDGGHSANDMHTLSVVAYGPLSLDGTMNASTLLERSACVTSGAGPGGAFQCGDLLLTHTMPAYRSRDRDRSLTLVYNSATAKPVPVIMGDVWLDGIAQPDSFTTTIDIGTQSSTVGWDASGLSGQPSRFSFALSASAVGIGTGIHPYTIETRSYYDGVPYFDHTRSHTSELIVVDRSSRWFSSRAPTRKRPRSKNRPRPRLARRFKRRSRYPPAPWRNLQQWEVPDEGQGPKSPHPWSHNPGADRPWLPRNPPVCPVPGAAPRRDRTRVGRARQGGSTHGQRGGRRAFRGACLELVGPRREDVPDVRTPHVR